jgi:O-antigen/teichoic acid export membrane protein
MSALESPGKNLRLNSVAVVSSSALTSLLGLAFWAVSAKLFPAAEVGIAAATTSSAMMLSTLASLSLGAMYERFLPLAGRRAGALVLHGS